MPTAWVNGLRLGYEIDGSGDDPVVALVGGLGDRAGDWGRLPALLTAAGRRVLRWDQRGSRAALTTPGPYTTAALATDGIALIAALGIARVDVFGYSLGGMTAQEWALAAPDTVASAALVSTSAATDGAERALFTRWRELAEHDLELVFDECARLSGYAAPVAPGDDEPVPDAGYIAQLDALLAHDARDRISGLAGPVLVAAGADDRIIAAERSRALADAIPQARWRLLDGGHAHLLSDPDALAGAYLEFLADASAPAAATEAA